jgi:two-component system, OmpR family, response regulator
MIDPVATVLIVEDDEPLRQILARQLRAHGFGVEEAPSAEDAQSAIEAGSRPGLVILDVVLPGWTGWDLLRSGVLAAAGSPPVVIATATRVDPRLVSEFGVAGVLPKPFAMEALLSTVERLLGTRRSASPRESPR